MTVSDLPLVRCTLLRRRARRRRLFSFFCGRGNGKIGPPREMNWETRRPDRMYTHVAQGAKCSCRSTRRRRAWSSAGAKCDRERKLVKAISN